MKNGKFLFIAMIFIVSLVCLSAVSAAEDAASDVIADTNDDTILEESIDDAGLGDSESVELEEIDENALSADGASSVDPPRRGSFKTLNDDVNNGADVVYLSYNYDYVEDYDSGFEDGIEISRNVTIYGNGHTINGAHKASIFYIPSTYTVIFKDINFVNAYAAYNGAAIYRTWPSNVTAINCTFTGNHADVDGGAAQGIHAINCTFINNTANEGGGAMFGGNATGCTFIGNSAGEKGGAIYNVNGPGAVNCTFTGNSAESGGALSYCDARDCIFTQNNAKNGGAIISSGAINCTFTKNIASEDGGALYDSYAINSTFTQNNATEDGGALYEGYVENCTFTNNSVEWNGGAVAFVEAVNCTFTGNSADGGGAIYNGSAVDCTFTGNSAGGGGAICFGNATNCIFTSNKASYEGGALYNDWYSENYALNCTFINNRAGSTAGAMNDGSAINCTFTGNHAGYNGGAICWAYVTNCNFTNNTANNEGGATYSAHSVNNSNFIGNKADSGGAISGTPNIENCTFISNSANFGGAIHSFTLAKNCTFILNTANNVSTNDIVYGDNETCNFIIPTLSASNFKTTYNYGEKFNFKIATADQTFNGIKTVISIYKNGAFVANYTALSGQGWIVKLAAGTYTAVININGSNVAPITKTITVAKNPTKLTAAAVTAVYNNNKYLVITLKDGKGKALSGVKVTVTLGTAKTYKTNKNGQIKINVGKLVPKTYTAKIKYAGTANYIASTKSVKVVVKKATPKMTAKAKSFKTALKTKKYTITLKNNKGKVMKSTKVSLTVNKKTYTVKTNKKGVASFKITNLKKKGKYTAVIKYAGNKYYKKLTKKATITAK